MDLNRLEKDRFKKDKAISAAAAFQSSILTYSSVVVADFMEENKMIVRCKHHQKNYTVIQNSILQNKELSLSAKGLLCELLSLPEDWIIHKESLERPGSKKFHINRIFKEFKDLGYAECVNVREGNRIIDREWIIYETPKKMEKDNLSTTGFLTVRKAYGKETLPSGKQPLQSNIKKQSNISKQSTNIYMSDSEKSDNEILGINKFITAWGFYPNRTATNNKKAAFRQWIARLKEGIRWEDMLSGVKSYQCYCNATGKTHTDYVMMASTFLGRDEHFKENWEDKSNAARASKPKTTTEQNEEFRASLRESA